MSWYNEVKESAEALKPGAYVARLSSVKHKDSKKGDRMIVLGFTIAGKHVSKYVVVRTDLAHMWKTELVKIGAKVQAKLDEAEADKLKFEQFFWLLMEHVQTRVGAEVEISVAYSPGNDLANIGIRKLVSEPRVQSTTVEREPGDDDDIPF